MGIRSTQIGLLFLLSTGLLLAFASCSAPLSTRVETDASLATSEWLDNQYGTNQSSDVRKLLSRVSTRLTQTLNGLALERESKLALEGKLQSYDFEVLLLRDPNPNAFSVGSGIIYITEGLLARLGSEAELAAVMAHELAHQLLGHTREAIQSQGLTQQESPSFSYSLKREIEADTLSLKILKVARYDLRHAETALSIGYRESDSLVSSAPPDWLSARMANIEQRIPELGAFLPATENSREFNKVKRRLFG